MQRQDPRSVDLLTKIKHQVRAYKEGDNPVPTDDLGAQISDFFSKHSKKGRERYVRYLKELTAFENYYYDDLLRILFSHAGESKPIKGLYDLGESELLRIRILEGICNHINQQGSYFLEYMPNRGAQLEEGKFYLAKQFTTKGAWQYAVCHSDEGEEDIRDEISKTDLETILTKKELAALSDFFTRLADCEAKQQPLPDKARNLLPILPKILNFTAARGHNYPNISLNDITREVSSDKQIKQQMQAYSNGHAGVTAKENEYLLQINVLARLIRRSGVVRFKDDEDVELKPV